jgi:hypothetical protein
MIDITQRKELVDILEEVYDTSSSSSDIIKGARQRIKEAKTMMKDWAERNEFDAEVVDNVYNLHRKKTSKSSVSRMNCD